MSPTWLEIENLPTPLTRGERRVLEFFDNELPPDWEIYTQPHMNGLRPDFVLLHPCRGIAVFEVKDWDLDNGGYRYIDENERLHAFVDGELQPISDPVTQVMQYKDEILDLYCPSLSGRHHYSLVSAGLVFTESSPDELEQLFDVARLEEQGFDLARRQYSLVSGHQLRPRNLNEVFPLWRRSNSAMTDKAAHELRSWLVQPEFSREQMRPLRLDKRQVEVATTRTDSGYRKVRGPAGSGKSAILAARAAELARQGKDVLVITFNITLLNYLRDLTARWPGGRSRGSITWLNYHRWAKRVCISAGKKRAYNRIMHSEAGRRTGSLF